MGYRMEYRTWDKRIIYKQCNSSKKRYLFLLIIPVIIASYIYKSEIGNFLLPGDPEVTKSAINVFVSEMKEGESVTSAFGSFCRVILDETNMS